jgi:hypothetical protein
MGRILAGLGLAKLIDRSPPLLLKLIGENSFRSFCLQYFVEYLNAIIFDKSITAQAKIINDNHETFANFYYSIYGNLAPNLLT